MNQLGRYLASVLTGLTWADGRQALDQVCQMNPRHVVIQNHQRSIEPLGDSRCWLGVAGEHVQKERERDKQQR